MIVRRFYFSNDSDKEALWLNDMALRGYLLKKAQFGKYTFERVSDDYSIHLAFDEDDIHTLEENGYRHICTLNHLMYFSKQNSRAHSLRFPVIDADSVKLVSYARYIDAFKIILLINVICAIIQLILGSILLKPETYLNGSLNVACALFMIFCIKYFMNKKVLLFKLRR